MHLPRDRSLVAVTLALVFTGCLDAATPVQPTAGAAIPSDVGALLVNEHDHADGALHRIDPWNLEVVERLSDLHGSGAQDGVGELDLRGDLLAVATMPPRAGFVLYDVSGEEPKRLGAYVAGTAYPADVKISPDGRYVYFATEPAAAFAFLIGGPGPGRTWAEQTLPGAASWKAPLQDFGVQVVSIEDPANPRLVGTLPTATFGTHMVDVAVIGGSTYLFLATIEQYDSRVDIVKVVERSGRVVLQPVAYYRPGGGDPAVYRFDLFGVTWFPHDMTVREDPITGKWLMYVAYWDAGVRVVEVSDPARPSEIGAWHDFDPVTKGNIHSVMPTIVDGKRILIATPEYIRSPFEGEVLVLDADDLGAIRLLGTWDLPGDHPFPADDYLFSSHNVNVADGKVYLAHYHAGAWILDVSTPERLGAPEAVAYAVPRGAETPVPFFGLRSSPMVWEVVPHGDRIFASDLTGGLHLLREGGGAPAPRPAT